MGTSKNLGTEDLAAVAVAPEDFLTTEILDSIRSLAATGSVDKDTTDFYRGALAAIGVDPESLSFSEANVVTRRLYPASDAFRTARREYRARNRAELAKVAEAKRAEEKIARDLAEIAALEAKIAARKAALES